MARYTVLYDTQAYGVGACILANTYRVNLPLVRKLRALVVEIDATTVAGALTAQAPEALLERIVLRADNHILVDLDGYEAWLLSSMLGYAIGPKNLFATTAPKCHIVIPFGAAFAVNLPTYQQVTVEITLAGATTRMCGGAITTLLIRLSGIEQDAEPVRDASGARLTRRFLRQQFTMAIGDNVFKLPSTEAYNNLMLVSLDALTNLLITLDADMAEATANIGPVVIRAAVPGRSLRVVEAMYNSLCGIGQFEGGVQQIDAAAAGLFDAKFRQTAWLELSEGGGPLDLPGLQASDFEIIPTARAATQLVVVRDTIVKG